MPVPTHPTDEKKAWIRRYLADPENLWKSHGEIREACKTQFGEVLGTTALNQLIREIRYGGGPPRPISATPPNALVQPSLVDSVAAIRMAMEKLGIESIRINENGKIEVVMIQP